MFQVLVLSSILIIAIFAIFFALWALDRRKATPPRHSCELSHAHVSTIDAQPSKSEPPMTLVLKLCGTCGNHFVFLLAGTWSIETLVLKESRVSSEIRTLEGMAK